VRIDAENLHVHRQDVAVFDGVRGIARSDVDGPRAELKNGGALPWRVVGEVEANRCADVLALSARQHMKLEHEIGRRLEARPEPPADERHLAGRPTEKETLGELPAVDEHAVVAGLGIFFVETAGNSRSVDEDSGMMHDFRIAWMEVDGANERRCLDRHGNDEVSIDVLSARRERIAPRHGDDEIRLSQLPGSGKRRRDDPIVPVSFGSSAFDPLPKHGALLGGKPPFSREGADPGSGSQGGMNPDSIASRISRPRLRTSW
jgi:hypothetical protein